MVKGIVRCPEIYSVLPNIRHLTKQILDNIKKTKFVIKAVLGRSANQVLCVEKNSDNQYRDLLRSIQWFNSSELFLEHVFKTIKANNPHKIIIEEYLATTASQIPHQSPKIPYDFKLYFVNNKVKLINLYSRGEPQGKFMAMFDRNWNRIPKNKFYVIHTKYPDKIGDVPLPSLVCRRSLIDKAEKLGRKLKTKICRFDFYCVGPFGLEKIYFGEITPICGGISLHPIKPFGLKLLYPPKIRKHYKETHRYNKKKGLKHFNKTKGGGRTKKNGKSLYYKGKKIKTKK